ncbi:MAG: hypothetical protein ACI8PP_002736 [Candidatus Pseudothioglobus sp.]
MPIEPLVFYLSLDPTKQYSLPAEYPEKTDELTALLAVHNAQQMTPMWLSIINTPQFIDKHGREIYAPGDEYIYWPN